MYNEELTDTSNKDLLVAINSIEKSLSSYKEPNYNDMSVVKQFAKSSSNIASFSRCYYHSRTIFKIDHFVKLRFIFKL